MNDPAGALAYVTAAAPLLGLSLDDALARRAADHLSRTAAMARSLDQADLGPEDELAEIYRPAPFPDVQDGSQLA